jgi:hypothetical protein
MRISFLIITGILYLNVICGFVKAQNKSYPVDTLNTPKIFLQGEQLSWENFPACSENGKSIILIHHDYSCCFAGPEELRNIIVADNSEGSGVLLTLGENLPDFNKEQNETIITEVNHILKAQIYYSMIRIDTFDLIKNASSSTTYIEFKYNNLILHSNDFKLPILAQHGYCCSGNPEDQVPCELIPNEVIVYINKEQNLLLIDYGYIHQADGCDIGPYYMIVKIE